MGWMPFPFTFHLRPLSVSRYCFTSVSPIPFSLLFFPSPLTFSEQVCRGASHIAQRKKQSLLQKLEETNTLGVVSGTTVRALVLGRFSQKNKNRIER